MQQLNLEFFRFVQLNQNDTGAFQELIRLFARVFEEPAEEISDNVYLEKLLAKPDFLVLVVYFQNKIVGGLTGYELQKYHRAESEFFIYDIAIDPAFQRNHLGTHLIERVIEICRQKGILKLFVDAHQDDEHAVRFYESFRPRRDSVIQFSFG